MTRFALTVGFLVAWSSPVRAQDDPPIANRPVDFSEIVGTYQKPKMSAAPTEVHVEEPIHLQIAITGDGPEKFEPNRKHLQRIFFDTWKDDFYVQELRDEHHVDRAKKTWVFAYRLKPKHARIDVIQGFKLVYYNPRIGGENKYVAQYARNIDIKVKPKPDQSATYQVELPAAPESFYVQTPGSEVLAPTGAFQAHAAVLVVSLVAPLICLVAGVLWRRCYPDAPSRARMHRRGAAQRALAELSSPSAEARDVVCRYLLERFALTVADPTPSETYALLKRRGIAMTICAQARSFLQACDAAQYAVATTSTVESLRSVAAHLIKAVEADPCVRD